MSGEIISDAPRQGKTFGATIHRIDDDGNGIIETTGGHINVGPVLASAVGEYVEALKLPGPFARVKTKRFLPPDYIEQFEQQANFDFSIDFGEAGAELHKRAHTRDPRFRIVDADPELVPYSERKTYMGKIDRINNKGHGLVKNAAKQISAINVGPVTDNAEGTEVEFVRLTRQYGVILSSDVRTPSYFSNHPGEINYELVDSRVQFDLGMSVYDRKKVDPNEAVIVNIPKIPADEYVVYYDGDHEVTVADDNPHCNPSKDVVVVVYREDLNEFQPGYSGDSPIQLSTLNEQDISHYAFPPSRLEPAAETSGVNNTIAAELDFRTDEKLLFSTVDRIAASKRNRLIRNGQQQINIGPVPVEPGYRLAVLQLNDQHNAPNAYFGFALAMLEPNTFSEGPSPADYLSELASLANLSEEELKNQLRTAIKTDSIKSPIFESKTRPDVVAESEADIHSESNHNVGVSSDKLGDTDWKSTSNKKGRTFTDKAVVRPSSEPAETSSISSKESTDLGQLRKKAEIDAQAEVSSSHTRTTDTTEYTRSTAVKNYAKARAEGVCENCGEEAPFVNPNGEPYLHAHHVHELSNGGADTPETVIALCPNCHYHAHHARDSEAFNKQLMERLAEIENVPIESMKNLDT